MCLIPRDKYVLIDQKNLISQLVKPFLIWDHQLSILWFEIDDPYL